jgi:hypothetical protein
VEYDPVDRVVVLKPSKGLDAGDYSVRVIAPKNASDASGIRAFDGVPMAEDVSWDFTVDTTTMAEEPNRKVDFCSAEQACTAPTATPTLPLRNRVNDIVKTCAGINGCHVPLEHAKSLIGEALLLTGGEDAGGAPAQIRRIIAEHLVAPETATAPDPGEPRPSGQDTFGRNMPFIDPNNPGNSYIIYKMIIGMVTCPGGGAADPMFCSGEGGTYGGSAVYPSDLYAPDGGICTDTVLHQRGDFVSYPAWVPVKLWEPPGSGEYERLRNHVKGYQMPKDDAASPYDIHLLSAWIANGAPTANCPVTQ